MKQKRFSNLEISAFCGQLSLILRSGISALEGITILLDDTENSQERAVLEEILRGMEIHGSLYPALAATELFPHYLLHMIKIGEETGTLDEVMLALSEHYEREDSISHSIRSAVSYPAVMAGMIILVIIILLVRVMPIFQQVFVQLGTEMTGVSRFLMDLGTGLNRYSVFFLALLALILCLSFYFSRTKLGKKHFQSLGSHIAPLRTIYDEIAACRFASAMALTLRSGLDSGRSIDLVCNLNEDPFFQKKLDDCQKRMKQGQDLASSLHDSGIFSGIYSRMASVGKRTGSMDQVMKKIAQLYQNDIDNRIGRSIAILEPTLVIGLSLVVGLILMSVMLPLIGIMSTL